MVIQPNTILADLIEKEVGVLKILERFKIKLGIQHKTIREVCEDESLHLNLLLQILQVHINPNAVIECKEDLECLPQLITYLIRSHRFFSEELLQEIEQLVFDLSTLLKDHTASVLLEQFYNDYVVHMKEHMEDENQLVFPYVLRLLQNVKNKSKDDISLDEYIDQHDEIQDELIDLRNILVRHIPQNEPLRYRRQLIYKLKELEQDLLVHSRLENELFIPLVQQLESTKLVQN